MKKQKVITIITIILLVLIICLASFLGIYVKSEYRVVNKVPKYSLGMEFTKKRVVNLQVTKPEEADEAENTEETENTEEADENNQDNNLNEDNYIKSEKIIKNRLKKLKVEQYKISFDKSNGNIKLVLPENDDTDEIILDLIQSGTVELKDNDTNEVLMDNSLVKKSKVVYSELKSGTGIYIQIKLNKEGKQKLNELKGTYKTNINEEDNNEQSVDTKTADLYINGEKSKYYFYFGNDTLDIVINVANDKETLNEYNKLAKKQVAIINSGILPIEYEEIDNVEEYALPKIQINIAIYVSIAVLTIMNLIYIIKFKVNGIYASILFIGHIGLLLFVIRYISDIKITYEGICGIIVGIIINYIYTYIAFKNIDLSFLKDTTLKLTIKLIPVFIIAIILCFISPLININGIGKVLVWSFITMYLYNLTLTQIMIKTLNK